MRLAIAISLVMALAGCGGNERASAPAKEPGGALPAIQVADVRDGSTLSLDSLAPTSRPLLVWFWAPY